jgi:hypothetical protein
MENCLQCTLPHKQLTVEAYRTVYYRWIVLIHWMTKKMTRQLTYKLTHGQLIVRLTEHFNQDFTRRLSDSLLGSLL